ncbi:retinol dehydrogenase 11-like isoform X1 [Diorhabda carinulata]|uniref:retinol dehydrogenase 11-like isoform X1 n=1 Tax=Diorhabda carinulata TaxID=1163345 RepID=UPI0025A30DA9|nr:retinol dehydrogenase 11-like isoform X1 [Diorhabda carinulata]
MIAEILLGTALATSVAALSLVSLKLYIKLSTGMCHSQVCLVGKTAIVTGANTGIGYETALDFAKRGARVILACRDETKAKEAYNKIIAETNNSNVVYKLVDLTSFDSVRKFAHDINANEDRLDILVNNAGAGRLGNKTTVDGISITMQTNYFSHFLLTILLLDLMKKYPSRIVNVSAIGAKLGRIDFAKLTSFTNESNQYITSKLCQILFTIELANRLKNTNITAYSLHPGVIKTEIFRNMSPAIRWIILFLIDTFFKTATEGAQTQIYCAIENGLEKYSGQHFHDCKMVKRYKSADDPALAKKLWEESERICKVNGVSYN